MDLRIGVIGDIVNSGRTAHCVEIKDDAQHTGGFLIVEWWDGSNGPNEHGAFDGWVENRKDLERYVRESNWKIRWRE